MGPEDTFTTQMENFFEQIAKGQVEELITIWYDALSKIGGIPINVNFLWNDIFRVFYKQESVLKVMPDIPMALAAPAYAILAGKFFAWQTQQDEEQDKGEN